MAVDYSVLFRAQNPANAMMGGIQQGMQLAAMKQSREANEAASSRAQEAHEWNKQKFQWQKDAVQKVEDQQRQMVEMSNNPETTAEDWKRFALLNPESSSAIAPYVEGLDERQKYEKSRLFYRVYRHLKTGNSEDAAAEAVKISESSENKRVANEFLEMAEVIKDSPDTASAYGDMLYAELNPEGFSQIYGKDLTTERILTEKERQKEVKQKTAKVLSEFNKDKKANEGFFDPETKLKQENELSKIYEMQGGKGMRQLEIAKNNIDKASATGVGGFQTIINFFKMIDPTSVVSSNEKATAESAPGMPAAMRSAWNRWLDNGKMDPEAYKQFVQEARVLHKNAVAASKAVEKTILNRIDGTNLEIENIIPEYGADEYRGEDAENEEPPKPRFKIKAVRIKQ